MELNDAEVLEVFDLLFLDRYFLDDLIGFTHLERDHLGFVQWLQVGHQHRPDQFLHALQPHYLHVHDALDFI